MENISLLNIKILFDIGQNIINLLNLFKVQIFKIILYKLIKIIQKYQYILTDFLIIKLYFQ